MTLVQDGLLEKPCSVHRDDTTFSVLERELPNDWQVHRADHYCCFTNKLVHLPDQGWKIHVSATPEHAAQIADIIYHYCIDKKCHFKILHSAKQLFLFNSKNWPRSASGKFAAIYPENERAFQRILLELGDLLNGFRGPYILSDLRFRDGPLFSRYGAFKDMIEVDDKGREFRAIYAPDGTPVPDERLPYFSKPDFASVPDILASDEPSAVTAGEAGDEKSRFELLSALKFSNAGGLYLAKDVQTQKIIRIREARPLAGLDAGGKDAVHRLKVEIAVLDTLIEEPSIPNQISHYQAWEHEFLASEYIEGETLLDELVKNYPFVHPQPDPEEVTAYLTWVAQTYERLAAALTRIHGRGVFIGDLHPSNIIQAPTGDVYFIDFENSGFLDDEFEECGLGAEGFYVRGCASGADLDKNSLRRTLLMLVCPMVPLLNNDGASETDLWAAAAELYDAVLSARSKVPECVARHFPEKTKVQSSSDLDILIDRVSEGIISRLRDRSDLIDFEHGEFGSQTRDCSLSYGDSGLVYALGIAGKAVPDTLKRSLLYRFDHNVGETGTGVFEGPLGGALALLHAGETQHATRIFEQQMHTGLPSNLNLYDGLTGHILAFLHGAEKLNAKNLEQHAMELGRTLLSRLTRDRDATVPDGAGILRGPSGLAVALIKLYQSTGGQDFLAQARAMIELDAAKGRFLDDGAFHILEGKRNLPYYDNGSAGLGIAIHRFLKIEDDDYFAELGAGIKKSMSIPFVMQSGLFQGRAGFIATANELDCLPAVQQNIERLAWYEFVQGGVSAFPGVGLSQVSDNLANGAAGVLLALSLKRNGLSDWFV